MKILTALVMIGTLGACAGMNEFMGIASNQGNGHKIDHLEKSYMVTVEYETPAMLTERNEKDAELRHLDEVEPIAFAGGQLIFKMQSTSLEGARQRNFEIFAERNDGEEFYRRNGSDRSIPNVPDSEGFWWSTALMPLYEPITQSPIDVYVVNTVSGKRDHFRIYPKDI